MAISSATLSRNISSEHVSPFKPHHVIMESRISVSISVEALINQISSSETPRACSMFWLESQVPVLVDVKVVDTLIR